jgi:catechol 2,3-dioxygenase-like lactoylglutathione lyase family enzyme
MNVTAVFGSIPVRDIAAARIWYERLFGRAPDLVPNDREACWQLTETAWVYVIADPERAGRGLHTILVDDLAAAPVGGAAIERKGGMRTAWITDPDGNRLQFGAPEG